MDTDKQHVVIARFVLEKIDRMMSAHVKNLKSLSSLLRRNNRKTCQQLANFIIGNKGVILEIAEHSDSLN